MASEYSELASQASDNTSSSAQYLLRGQPLILELTNPAPASNHLPADNQSLAAMIVEGSQAEQSGKSTNYDARVKSDDATSVMSRSSFGSTVGLLKNKLNPSSKSNRENDKQRGKEQRELLRNQMRIVG